MTQPISDETRAALLRLARRVQQFREEGEFDMRDVLNSIDSELAGNPLTEEEDEP